MEERDCFSRKYAQTHRQRASRGDRWTEGRKEGGEQTREQASDHEAEPHCVARRRRFLLLTNDDGPCADADSERGDNFCPSLTTSDAKWSGIVGLERNSSAKRRTGSRARARERGREMSSWSSDLCGEEPRWLEINTCSADEND